MKKISKVAALLAASALLFGGMFLSCSDSDDDGNTTPVSGTPAPTPTPTPTPTPAPSGETVTYKAEEITEAELALMKDSSGSAPAAGTNTKLAEGTYSIWGGKGAIVTAKDKMAIQIETGKTTPKAIVSATNMSGSTASAVPVVGANLSSIIEGATEDKAPVNYVKVATPGSGNSSISLNISTDASTKDLGAGLSYWILATDESGKILAVKDIGDIKGSASYTTQDVAIGTATLGENVCLGFARGAGSGGLKIHSITITKTSKSAAAAPVSANFVATACTTKDQNDGKITISNETVANLEYKLSTADSYADVTGSSLENLAAGTYQFRYKETDNTLASEAIEVTVEKYVDTSISFTKFDAKELYGDATADVNIEADKEASDGTWKLIIASGKKAQVKAGEFATYDYNAETSAGYKWTNRLSFNKQAEGDVTLKLKVGAGATKILRVDGGSVKTLPESGKTNLTFKGAGEAVVWEPYVGKSTTYVEVTGDADGYVSITSTDTTNGANIYGITVVESKPATLPGSVELTTKLTTAAVYSAPVISDGYTAVATQGETLSGTATLTQPTKSTSTPVYADGSLGTPVEGTESVEESSVIWTTTYGENVLTLGTGLSLAFATSATATDANYVPAGTYSVTASYKIGETAYTSDPISVQVKEAGATYVTVTFNANGGTDGSTTTQDVESGVATALTTVSALGLTAPSGKTFAGWALSADATEAVYTDGANITVNAATTLYAVWAASSSYTVTYALPDNSDLSGASTLSSLEASEITAKIGGAATTWATNTEKFKYDGESSNAIVAYFATNLRTTADDALAKGNYAEIIVNNKSDFAVKLDSVKFTHAIKDKNSGYGCQAYYYVGDSTTATALGNPSTYGSVSAILTTATVSPSETVTIPANSKLTLRFVYYGGNNGGKECALKDVVITFSK